MPGTRLDAALPIPRRSTDSGTAAAGGDIGIGTGDTRGGSNDFSAPGAQVLSWFPELEGKDPTQQVEMLNQLLEKEGRIKDGAENLLRMQLTVYILRTFSIIFRLLRLIMDFIGCLTCSSRV